MQIQNKLAALLGGLLLLVVVVSLLLAPEGGINVKFGLNLFFVSLSVSSFFIWPILITKEGQSEDRFIFGLGYSSISGIYFVATLLVVLVSLLFSIESLGTLLALHLLLLVPLVIFIFFWNSSADKVEEISRKRVDERDFFENTQLRLQSLALNIASVVSNSTITELSNELAEEFKYKNSRSTDRSAEPETLVCAMIDKLESELKQAEHNEESILKNLKTIQTQLELRELALKNG